MKRETIAFLTRAGLIGALYAALTVILAPISYGPIQVRVSEALTILSFFSPSAIIGLWAGCFVANFISNAGIYDVAFGSLLTAMAAYLTYLLGKRNLWFLAPLPTVVLNAFGVSAYLQYFYKPPNIALLGNLSAYWIFVITIGIGELIACYIIGLPLLLIISHSRLKSILQER